MMWPKTSACFAVLLLLYISISSALPATNDSRTSAQHSEDGNLLKPRGLVWQDAVDKGNDWLYAMTSSAAKARQYMKAGVPVTSPFTTYNLLERWGWVQELDAGEPLYESALDLLFRDLGIDKRNNQFIGWLHSQEVENDEGEEVDPTEAQYWNVYNIKDGAIIADWIISPSESASCDLLPDLQSWSDVTFLQWQKLCEETNTPLSRLKYIIQSDAVNFDTKAMVRHALGKPANFENWEEIKDGVTWSSHDDQLKAILASPNGRGGPWFLTQHKPQLRHLMTVSELTARGVLKETERNGQKETRWILVLVEKIEIEAQV